jgi:hypothetical protein
VRAERTWRRTVRLCGVIIRRLARPTLRVAPVVSGITWLQVEAAERSRSDKRRFRDDVPRERLIELYGVPRLPSCATEEVEPPA